MLWGTAAPFRSLARCVLLRWASVGFTEAQESVVNERPLHSGERVTFKLSSVICPDAEEVINQMTTEVELTGQVVFLSDYGFRKDHFAIVDIPGVSAPVIVPVQRLKTDKEAALAGRSTTQ